MIDVEFENRCGDELREKGDYAAAAERFRRAARQECPQGTYKLGLMYYQGLGVERDYRLAAALFLCAAEADVSEAQQSLSTLFKYGRYVPQNYDLSQEWLSAGESQMHLMRVLNHTIEFIDPEIINEIFADEVIEDIVEAAEEVIAVNILPELETLGYAVGDSGRSAKIRRGILAGLAPDRAMAMLNQMIDMNKDAAALADLTADLQFIKQQKDDI